MPITDYITCPDDSSEIKNINSSIINKNVTFINSSHKTIPRNRFSIAILGIPDSQFKNEFHCSRIIKSCLYKLVEISNGLKIIDLGDIKCGDNFNDTCNNISNVVIEMSKINTKVILIGGSARFHWGFILANQKNNVPVNLVSIDSEINPEIFAPSFVNNFTDGQDSILMYNFTNIGYQSYLVEKKTLDVITDLYFEAYRLGNIRGSLDEMEPVLRDSNLLNFSLNAVKYSDSPASAVSNPNGLTGDEACQLSFFAGHSNRITAFGLYDLNPHLETSLVSAKLGAQIIWYLLEGFANRLLEEPDINPESFTNYIIHNSKTNQDISFYKSNLTNRWWMEIINEKTKSKILVSCSENDYILACSQEIPERWWRVCLRQNKVI